MQGFFRSFCLLCSNFDSAFRLATFFVPNMILYVGYMIPVSEMKRWLFWIVSFKKYLYQVAKLIDQQFYINPVAYGAQV